MLLGKLDNCMRKAKTRSMSFTLYKYQLKCINNLNVRLETFYLVQKRAESTLELIGTSNDILNRALMAQQLKEMIGKWYYMKL
jgi:hypothetical protein